MLPGPACPPGTTTLHSAIYPCDTKALSDLSCVSCHPKSLAQHLFIHFLEPACFEPSEGGGMS